MSEIKGTELMLDHFKDHEAAKRYQIPSQRSLFNMRSIVLDFQDPVKKMEEIRIDFHNTFDLYEKIFECIRFSEAFYTKPVHKLRHPMIFYYGHTAAFYINKLCVAGLSNRINPEIEKMFAVGVDEMSWDDIGGEHFDWPSVEEVTAYRRHVRDHVDLMIRSGIYPLSPSLNFITSTQSKANSFWWVMLMGIEHERIHIETASVHIREMPIQFVREEMKTFWDHCLESGSAVENELISENGGVVSLGRPSDHLYYGWDCDYSHLSYMVSVKPFQASRFLVSNGEFLPFIKEGGYQNQIFWDEEGWNWLQYTGSKHPYFWVLDSNIKISTDADSDLSHLYKLRLQTVEIPMPWNWPVELNHFEAHAFCKYLSQKRNQLIRMPTEEEWRLLFDRYVSQDVVHPELGEKYIPANLAMSTYRSSCPVNKFSHGPYYDLIGNTWQHTETSLFPYPGFSVHPFYDDFSAPTFDGRHFCMKGGAWVSTGNEATRDARYAFRRHFFQYIGLRYISGEPIVHDPNFLNGIFRDLEMDSITLMCFPPQVKALIPPNEITDPCMSIADLAKTMYQNHSAEVINALRPNQPRRALDLACGAGRVSFELSTLFDAVVGVEFTARFLIPAYALLESRSVTYENPEDNTLITIWSNQYPTWQNTMHRCTFFQADPSNLHSHIDNFDLIVAWNVMEKSHSPQTIPSHLLSRLNPGGIILFGVSDEFGSPLLSSQTTESEISSLTDLFQSKGEAVRCVLNEPTYIRLNHPNGPLELRFYGFVKE